ncbi:MAG: hypothetical protein KDC83_01535 [Flavobacteriales bacterium]|nr:hypothetical protein [Flavobacteriales bacterium]
MNQIALLFFFLLFSTRVAHGQNTLSPETKSQLESLNELRATSMRAESDKERIEANNMFKSKLKNLIASNHKFPFDSIKNFGLTHSPNKAFSFYTWNIITDDYEYTYFNWVRFKNGDLLELVDQSKDAIDPPFETYSYKKWYGALYYEIIPIKDKKEGLYYVLLGWDGNGSESTKKVIDVMYFDEKYDEWRFGKKVFYVPFQDNYRIIMEYSAEVTMSLKYHKKRKQIVFDHLVPASVGMEGIYEYYVPDMSFDALEYRKDQWYFIQNVDVRGEQTMENYTYPIVNTPSPSGTK